MQNERRILVVDSDRDFTQNLVRQNKSSRIDLVIAHNRADALTAIAHARGPFASVLVNKKLADYGTYSVVRQVHVRHLGTPVYLLSEEPIENEDLKENLNALGIRQVLPKPLTYEELVKQLESVLVGFKSVAPSQGIKDSSMVGTELGAPENDFTPIRAQHFLSGHRSHFSVYVQIRSNRFLKILNAGDVFDARRLEQYLARGIQWFHIRKDAHRSYLEYCDFVSKKLIEHGMHSIETQRDQVLNLGEETLRYFGHAGVSGDLIHYAVNFVQDCNQLTKKLQLDRHREIGAFMNNLVEWEHSVSVALVTSLLMRGLRIENERVQNSIGLAALLHDIGKIQTCPSLIHEDLTRMTEQEIATFKDHAWAGATMIAGVPGIDSTTVQAVAQHHERRNGKGFPLGLGAGKINRVAEIVGLADEYTNLIHKNKVLPEITKIHFLQDTLLDGFSTEVVDSLCVLFLRN
ncbi:MAG TPA: HD domain-containing protein [Oligoflexia bacterium]|nr:HD domain-containing protein [Oligoflexia bacterium]